MPYRVDIAPTAEWEIEQVFRHIHADSPINAERWRRELADIFDHLHLFPEGCGLAPENSRVDFEVRQTFHGVYIVIAEGDVFSARLWRDAPRRDSRHGASCHNAASPRYRILLTIEDDRVVILHFRHGAQRPLMGHQIARPE